MQPNSRLNPVDSKRESEKTRKKPRENESRYRKCTTAEIWFVSTVAYQAKVPSGRLSHMSPSIKHCFYSRRNFRWPILVVNSFKFCFFRHSHLHHKCNKFTIPIFFRSPFQHAAPWNSRQGQLAISRYTTVSTEWSDRGGQTEVVRMPGRTDRIYHLKVVTMDEMQILLYIVWLKPSLESYSSF